jgi:hypothetical protein
MSARIRCRSIFRLADDAVQVDDGRLQHLLAAEGEELPRERGCAMGGALDVLEPAPRRVAGSRVVEEQARAADDRRQQVG